MISADIPYVNEAITYFMLRWPRRMGMHEHCQAGILDPLVGVADVKITMTLGDHDRKGLRC